MNEDDNDTTDADDDPDDDPDDDSNHGGTPGESTGVRSTGGVQPHGGTHRTPGESTGVRPHEEEDQDAEVHQAAIERNMEERYGPRTEQYSLRQRKERDYSHLFATSTPKEETEVSEDEDDAPLATPQMSMQRGLKVFGEDGVAAVKKEMLQLHERKVMQLKPATELTREQKKEALAYLMFLKRKRCRKVKERGCADGWKQRAYTSREDAASPTVATESVFLTAVIDAMENRDVAVVDVPGAFMQADMDELVHLRYR
jgi:hypothetical protein